MNLDDLKATVGKHGKVSKKGLYSGLAIGRFSGGYLGLKAGEKLFTGADILEVYPELDPGSLGPEESAIYAAVVGGYFLGGLGLAKGVTKYQELRDKDLEYTRPLLHPSEKLKDVDEFLEGEKEEESDLQEAIEYIFGKK